ncbi:MAG: hypothetical protein IKV79_01010 [Oscillospiraceae bacterium]|nr:hypothetical protein [Oscillospiraceae bacterium]
MKNKLIACFLMAALAIGLCGCRLALPEGEGTQRDRLIGCFITTEHLDLFDFEAYFNDNAHKLVSGETMLGANDAEKYRGRLYAEKYEEKYTDSEGVSHTTYNYRFPDLEGIAYFAPTIYESDGGSYVTFQSGEGLSDLKNHLISHNDDTYFTELSATVYAPVDAEEEFTEKEICFYMNPVYQAADGSVYLVGGNGTAMNSVSAGIIMTTTLSEEYKTTVNGEEKTGGGSVEISFATAYVPVLLRVIEMDGKGNVLNFAAIAADELPESYEPNKDASYIITESVSYDAAGEEVVQRSIIEPGNGKDDLYILVECENGYLVEDYCEVMWE